MPANKLRVREAVFAVAMGALAAGGAALILTEGDDKGEPAATRASEQTYAVAPFEEIATVGPQDVVVTLSDGYAVRSEGTPEALSRLEAVVEDGKLSIRPKNQFAGGFNWGRVAGATFYVTLPRLEAVSLAGSGDMRVDRISGERFEGSVAGPGELAIGAMEVERADFTIAGPGNLVAAGTAGETHVSIAGSGEVRASGLRSRTASVSMAGSGDAALTVDEDARVSIMGSGDVDIAGPARCTVSRMGSGDVRCSESDNQTN